MNVSYEWLRAFVPFEETPAQLRELITTHAATVDDLVHLRADLAPIVSVPVPGSPDALPIAILTRADLVATDGNT